MFRYSDLEMYSCSALFLPCIHITQPQNCGTVAEQGMRDCFWKRITSFTMIDLCCKMSGEEYGFKVVTRS